MSKRKDNYSVFVGHLSQSTTKEDLTGLFSKCGNIVEIFTLNSDDQNYAYGFVRYKNKDSALQAVQELDKWQMNGLPMIVDLSRETKVRIQEEDELEGRGNVISKTPPEKQDINKRRENSRGYIEDVINLSRFQECCHQLNTQSLQSGNKQKINGDKLLNDISEMSYHAAPNITSELVNYEAVELHSLTKKLLSHSYGCTEQGLSEKDTKEFFLALEVIMDTIQSFTAFCNHGVKPEVLRQAEEVRKNQKLQNEQNILQNLKPLVNDKESSIYKKNDVSETAVEKSADKNVKEGIGNELPGNQDIRHCKPKTYIKSTDENTSNLKIKENYLKELLLVGKGSKNNNVKKYDELSNETHISDKITNKHLNILMNTDSDSDDCDFSINNAPKHISSLKDITTKTIPQENYSGQNVLCTPEGNNGDISSLKQIKHCQSDTEMSKKQNQQISKKGILGSAPVNMQTGVLNGGDGLLGAVPQRNQASLRSLNSGPHYTPYSTKPGLLGSAPYGPQYQAFKGNSLVSLHSLNNSLKPSDTSQTCLKKSITRKTDTWDRTLPTYNTNSKVAEQTSPTSLAQLSASPSNNCNFSFGRGRGFLFKS